MASLSTISLSFAWREEALARSSGASSLSEPKLNASRNGTAKVHRAAACLPVEQPPEGKHWIHEVKHDGYRSQVVIERGQVRVFSRNGHDWSDRYPSIVRAAAKLRANRQSLMVRPSSKTTTALLTLRHYGRLCDGSRKASSYTHSICCISTARTCGNKPS